MNKNCHKKISDQNASKCHCTALVSSRLLKKIPSLNTLAMVFKVTSLSIHSEKGVVLTKALSESRFCWYHYCSKNGDEGHTFIGSCTFIVVASYPTRLLRPTRLLWFYKCSLPKLWASPGFGGTTIAPKMVVRARSCEIMLIWSWACFFLLWSFS